MDDSSDAIGDLVAQLVETQLDIEPFLALHAEDVVLVNLAGRRVLGRPALREAMASALETSLADVKTTAEVDDIRFLRPDVAIVSCTKRIHDLRADGGGLPEAATLTYVVAETDAGWRVALAQTTPALTQPAREPTA